MMQFNGITSLVNIDKRLECNIMKRVVTVILMCMLLLVGCTSTEDRAKAAHEVYDVEYFCVNAVNNIGGRGYRHLKYTAKDYVVYTIWAYDGRTKYYIDENGEFSEDEVSVKVRYSEYQYIDYTFGFGEYAEDNTDDSTTVIYNNVYLYDSYDDYDYDDYDNSQYYNNGYYNDYYYDDDIYYYYDEDDYYYEDYYDDFDDYSYYYEQRVYEDWSVGICIKCLV